MSLCQFSPARRTPIGRPSSVTLETTTISGAALHAPSFTEDVELDFAKTAGKRHLLRRRDVLIAEKDDGVVIVGAVDSGERLVVDGSGQVDTADLGAERGARRNNLDRHSWLSRW